MAGQNNLVESKYYSGQGVVLLSDRDSVGRPTGFEHIGNVSALSISMEITELEHKESFTGARVVDLTIITENSVSVDITAESITAKNLAFAMFGDAIDVIAGSVASLIVRGNQVEGKTSYTDHLSITGVGVESTAFGSFTFATVIATDEFVVGATTYTVVAGAPATDVEIQVGATDAAMVLNAVAAINAKNVEVEARVGPTSDVLEVLALLPGVAGNALATTTADATITPLAATCLGSAAGVEGTDFDVNDKGGSVTLKTTSTIFPTGVSNIDISYSYGAHTRVEAFTQGKVDKWLRFEGLNTARSNKAVVVDIFKFSPTPLDTQSLIGDDIAEITISGNALADTLRPAGLSQFFREMIDES